MFEKALSKPPVKMSRCSEKLYLRRQRRVPGETANFAIHYDDRF